MTDPKKRYSRAKGGAFEREVKKALIAEGIYCEKMPLSGALGGKYRGDLCVGDEFRAECKRRKTDAGFSTIEKWLGDYDVLFTRKNHGKILVVMQWEHYLELMKVWLQRKQ